MSNLISRVPVPYYQSINFLKCLSPTTINEANITMTIQKIVNFLFIDIDR